MLKNITRVLFSPKDFGVILNQQLRNTYILKRRFTPLLHKKNYPAKRLRGRHYIYDLVEDTSTTKTLPLEIILTSYVDGVGDIGDKVSLSRNYAYNKLLLPGLAVYASPENLEDFKNVDKKEQVTRSSPNAQITMDCLSRLTLSVIMNKEIHWTIKQWHIEASFRKCGFRVPGDTISLPAKPISGPDLKIENKEFYVTVTINNMEKVNVRCRVHHWSTSATDKLYQAEFWKIPSDPIFPEDAHILASFSPPSACNEAESNSSKKN